MKKALILTGPLGIGLSKISFNVAKSLTNNKINTEIVLFDHIKLYKNLNLIADKPPLEYTSEINYHNLNTKEISEAFNMNSAIFSTQTRQILNSLLKKDVNPLIQGGSFFYIKSLATGGSNYLTENEVNNYKKARIIAKSIIQFDNYNFEQTLKRLENLDSSFLRESVPENDFYRLERRYADYIFYGNGAYIKNLQIDNKMRSENYLNDVRMYKIFVHKVKNKLMKIIEDKCITLLKDGLMVEVINLIHDKLITPKEFYSVQNPLRNSYGISEAIDLLIKLNEIYPNKESYLASLERDNINLYNQRREILKIFSEFIRLYVTGTYQYNSKQLSQFYKDEECYLLNLEDDCDTDKVSETIQKIYSLNFSEFLNKNKEDRAGNLNLRAPVINPKWFDLLASNINLHPILKKIFDEYHKIKDEIALFEDIKKGHIPIDKLLSYNEIKNYL